MRASAGGAVTAQDLLLFPGRRIADGHFHQEAVALRAAEAESTFFFHRVLGGDHHEQRTELVGTAELGRHLPFLHRLQYRTFRTGPRTVQLVRQQEIRVQRSLDDEVHLAGGRIEMFDAHHVLRQQVRGEGYAPELNVCGLCERLEEQRLGETRHALQQDVPAGKQADQSQAHFVVHADDAFPDLGLEVMNLLPHLREFGVADFSHGLSPANTAIETCIGRSCQ